MPSSFWLAKLRIVLSARCGWTLAFWTVLAAALALLPVLVTALWPSFNGGMFSVFAHLAGLLLLPLVFGVRVRRWLTVCWLFVLMGPLAVYCFLTTRQQPSEWFFLVLSESNVSEASAFAPQITGAAVLLAVLVLAYRAVLKQIPGAAVLPWASRTVVLMLAFGLPLLKVAAKGLEAGLKDEQWRVMENYPVGSLTAVTKAAGLTYEIAGRDKVGRTLKVSRKASLRASDKREIHLLVLGETTRAASFQLDGYERETTPKLKTTEGIVNFTDVIAPAPVTMISVPVLLTPTTAETARQSSTAPSVMQVFQKAGYKTYWLSTQPKHGFWDTRPSSFSNDADETLFLSGKLAVTGEPRDAAKDIELVAAVRDILARGEQKVFIVLHTMGSHAIYADRYPPEFNKFAADPSECAKARRQLMTSKISREQATMLRNSYDNTILYTDHVLHELISDVRGTGAVSTVYYVSDHGENSGDAPVLPFAHGTLTSEVLRVPMFAWLSPEYRSEFPDKVAALTAHAEVPTSADATFHTLVDMVGLVSEVADPRRSLASSEFRPGSRVVTALDGTLSDYDKDVLPGELRKGWKPLHMIKGGAVVSSER